MAGARRCCRRAPLTYQPACKPGSVWRGPRAKRLPRVTAIPLGRRLPGASSNLPGRQDPDTGPGACASAPSLFGLAPGGVCHAASVAGSAVRSYRTVSPLPSPSRDRGGLFSVALSLEFARLRELPRRTLSGTACPWSPDFPLSAAFRHCTKRPSGRLTAMDVGALRQSDQCKRGAIAVNRRRSVSTVEGSAIPSTRAGRKCRWNAVTTCAVVVVVVARYLEPVAETSKRFCKSLDLGHRHRSPTSVRPAAIGAARPTARRRRRQVSPTGISRPDPSCARARHPNARAPARAESCRRSTMSRQSAITASICASGNSR